MESDLTKLYYDGDSYSCELPRGQTQTTGHVIADRLGYELDHYGFSGKSPPQIIRSSIRYSLEDFPYLMLIGIGVNSRLESYSDEVISIPNRSPEYKTWKEEKGSHNFSVIHATQETQKLFHWQYMEVNLLFNLLQLHDYLLHNNKNFIMHNLGWNFAIDYDFIFSNKIYDQIKCRPRFVNIFENSLHDLLKDTNIKPWDFNEFGWNGHPDELGHAMYADYLMEHINE